MDIRLLFVLFAAGCYDYRCCIALAYMCYEPFACGLT